LGRSPVGMTQVGQNWNQLLEELVGWQSLGKDILAAQVSRDNAFDLVR